MKDAWRKRNRIYRLIVGIIPILNVNHVANNDYNFFVNLSIVPQFLGTSYKYYYVYKRKRVRVL